LRNDINAGNSSGRTYSDIALCSVRRVTVELEYTQWHGIFYCIDGGVYEEWGEISCHIVHSPHKMYVIITKQCWKEYKCCAKALMMWWSPRRVILEEQAILYCP